MQDNPADWIREICIIMAMDTHTDAFKWLDLPLMELGAWVAAKKRVYDRMHKKNGNRKKRH